MVAEHGHGKYTNDGFRCDVCRAAASTYNRAWLAARRRAVRRLMDAHPEEFAAYLLEEKRAAGRTRAAS